MDRLYRGLKLLSIILARISLIHRQKCQQLLVSGKRRLEFFDFYRGIGGVRDFALKKVCEPELAFSVVEFKVEFLRVCAADMNRSDVAHRGDSESRIERDELLLRRVLLQLQNSCRPARTIVVLRIKPSRVRVLQNFNYSKSLRSHLAVLHPNQRGAIRFVKLAEFSFVRRKVGPSQIIVASQISDAAQDRKTSGCQGYCWLLLVCFRGRDRSSTYDDS